MHDSIALTALKNEVRKMGESRFQQIIAGVEYYAIFILERDGTIATWNKGAENIKGYTAQEIIGKNYRIFYPPEDVQRKLPEKLLAIALTEGTARHEGWRIRKNGTPFWGSITITALHDDTGNAIGFLKVTRDLTEKKRAEDELSNIASELRETNEALRQSESRYHKMIEEIQDYAIILLNPEGIIENWNAGASCIKGYNAQEVIGKNFRIFYTQKDIDEHLPEQLLREAAEHGKSLHEGWRVRKDGSEFWGSVVITALHDQHGNVTGFSKVTRDLTERKLAEDFLKENSDQLDQKNKILEQLNNELSSFNYIASHDLKEPLRKIQTFATLLEEKDKLSDRGKEYVDKIKLSAHRMQNLIEDLLWYSRITNSQNEFEQVSLQEVIHVVLQDLEIHIQEKNASIECESLPAIEGVSFQLQQLFLNLLSNALKFSKPEVVPVIKITSSGEDSGKYWQITVIDNGIGFEPQYAEKIFNTFQRLHSVNTFSGTGIGLAIVKKVMENHGGFVIAEGSPDVGARFHLYFPREKVIVPTTG